MKKITDFIIDKRYLVLTIFLILAVISTVLSTKVNINYDISNYLPSDSETRIGLDIMDQEFNQETDGVLRVMIKDLSSDDKTKVYDYLKNIKDVSDVEYDDTEEYNKDGYTLYVLTINGAADSDVATAVYNEVEEHFKDNEIATSGDVSSQNESVLPLSIVALAIGCATVILIVMCESYIEPFLFLASIFIAILLNNGTNIMFSSVSNITNSISAILQIALSMDYSIMLMNRYQQEKEREKDNRKAMKNALYYSFKSISSSSITTIVGLLALVFMSFTIGRDLGFVLAKGVLFSLLSIFTCLPAFILMADKLITKTKKKSPTITLNSLGKFAFKFRYIAIILFIVIFGISFLLKGDLGILYTNSEDNKVAEVFPENNQIAVIYKNEFEKEITEYCKKLEENDKVDDVLCYGNTINESFTYDKLSNKLTDLGSDVKIDDYLLRIIYYYYNNKDIRNKMTLNELITFIKKEVYDNEKMSDSISKDVRKNIDKLANFTNKTKINKKRSASEIASVLGIEKSKVNDLLVYYNSRNINIKMSIPSFVNFMNNYVLKNKKYASSVNSSAKSSLNRIAKFTNKSTISNKKSYREMAKLFGMSEDTLKQLYTYYVSVNEINTKLTINEFVSFLSNNVMKDPTYKNSFDASTKNNIMLLKTFSDKNYINKKMNALELSQALNMDQQTVGGLLYLNQVNEMSLYELVNFMLKNASTLNLDQATVTKLMTLKGVMDSTNNNVKYSYKEIASVIGIDTKLTKNIYTLYISNKNTTKLTPREFVNFVLKHKNDQVMSGKLNSKTINELTLLQKIMSSVVNNKSYSTKELSNLLGIGKSDLELIYSLYNINYKNKKVNVSLDDFVSFINKDVLNNKKYASNFNSDSKKKIKTIDKIINGSLKKAKYNKDEVYNLLKNLTNDLDKDLIDLVYIYYGSENQYDKSVNLTVEEFVRFINEDILTDKRFDDFIGDDMRNNITDSRSTINDAKELLVGNEYSRVVINTKLPMESEETFNFIEQIKKDLSKNVSEFYVIGDSPMALEMSKSFQGELDFITILTMIFIFVVVAFTFKSILIPLILVLLIQCAVYLTMGILSFSSGTVYFIALLIVQSILMGATIDYAILYTSYYLESRETMDVGSSVINAYNKSIHTILTSASILVIVTLIVGNFASAIAAKICKTLSEGTLCSAILILLLLPALLAAFDKLIVKKKKNK